MTETATIYARVSLDAKRWLDEQTARTGIPIAKILDAILQDAMRRGVRLEVSYPVIVVPEDKDAP